jgi:hypothetical protein
VKEQTRQKEKGRSRKGVGENGAKKHMAFKSILRPFLAKFVSGGVI